MGSNPFPEPVGHFGTILDLAGGKGVPLALLGSYCVKYRWNGFCVVLLHLGVKPKSRVLDNFQVRKFTCSKKYFISANLIKKILLIQIIRKSKFLIYLEFQELIVLYILLEFPGPHQISSRLRILSRYQKSDGISSISSDFPLKERCPWVKFRA